MFRRQVEALARAGRRTLGSTDLAARLARPGDASDLVLTFDDAYTGLEAHAFPVLADLGMQALVFVITEFVGRDNTWDLRPFGASFPHLDWDTLAIWQARGVIEVHSHAATHPRLTWLDDARAADELARSRRAITERLGRAPAVICYPFGAADERVARLARAAGYTIGMVGANAAVPGDPLRLGRLMVYPWDRASPPRVLASGVGGAVARWAARTANRFAVVTSIVRRPGTRR